VAENKSTGFYIVMATLVLACVVAAAVWLRRPGATPPPAQPTLTEEQRVYLGQIVVSDARMSAAENFLGDMVVYLDAQVMNRGDKAVRHLELELEFVDLYRQVVLRERATPVTPRTSPLKPGETRAFRISFENVPGSWNQAPPSITPTRAEF